MSNIGLDVVDRTVQTTNIRLDEIMTQILGVRERGQIDKVKHSLPQELRTLWPDGRGQTPSSCALMWP